MIVSSDLSIRPPVLVQALTGGSGGDRFTFAGAGALATVDTVTDFAPGTDKLALSVKTISMYRSRLLQKMKLRNNAELTHYALKHQLVPDMQ